MFIVLGATGNIGSQIVKLLSANDHDVIAVTHSREKIDALERDGVEAVAVDVTDVERLRDVFRRGKRAFLLNPPAAPTNDTNSEELRTAGAIADAVKGSGLEKVVVASTYGALEGDAIGDLSVLWEFERLVGQAGVPMAVNRGAYYFTNLDMLVESARLGELPTSFPGDLVLPMISPVDLARAAVSRLKSPIDDVGVAFVEGPARYTFTEVATVFSDVLGRDVKLNVTPRDRIEITYRDQGFSEQAAQAFTRMTLATLGGPELPKSPQRGSVTLESYVRSLVGGLA